MTEFDFADARDRLRKATQAILDLETAYERAVEHSADAEAVYRRDLAEAFKRFRESGSPVAEAETLARAETATLSRERDYASGMLKLAGEKLEDGRDSRRSLWRLIEWARVRDTARGTANTQLAKDAWP